MTTTNRHYFVMLARDYQRRALRKDALARAGQGTALDSHNADIYRIARDRCMRHARREA